jgi:hypothetical protein
VMSSRGRLRAHPAGPRRPRACGAAAWLSGEAHRCAASALLP